MMGLKKRGKDKIEILKRIFIFNKYLRFKNFISSFIKFNVKLSPFVPLNCSNFLIHYFTHIMTCEFYGSAMSFIEQIPFEANCLGKYNASSR